MLTTPALVLTTASMSIPIVKKVSPKTADAIKAGMIGIAKAKFCQKTGFPPMDIEIFKASQKLALQRIGMLLKFSLRKIFPKKSIK